MQHFDIRIGQLIRAARISRNLSQMQLADRVDLSFQQLQKYEAGKNRVTCGRIWRLSKALDVHVNYFFQDMPEDPADPASNAPSTFENNDHRAAVITEMSIAPPPRRVIELALRLWSIEDRNLRNKMLKLIDAVAPGPSNDDIDLDEDDGLDFDQDDEADSAA